jgi:hypothetical protein
VRANSPDAPRASTIGLGRTIDPAWSTRRLRPFGYGDRADAGGRSRRRIIRGAKLTLLALIAIGGIDAQNAARQSGGRRWHAVVSAIMAAADPEGRAGARARCTKAEVEKAL